MKHKFEGGMTTGTPDNPPEGYSYCAECGAEETDDSRDGECVPVEDDASVVAPILPPYDDGWAGRRHIKSAIDRLREQGFTDVET